MKALLWILLALLIAAALAPLLLRLARRWRPGLTGVAAGGVAPDTGMGSYITSLRMEHGYEGSHGDGDGHGGDSGGDGDGD